MTRPMGDTVGLPGGAHSERIGPWIGPWTAGSPRRSATAPPSACPSVAGWMPRRQFASSSMRGRCAPVEQDWQPLLVEQAAGATAPSLKGRNSRQRGTYSATQRGTKLGLTGEKLLSSFGVVAVARRVRDQQSRQRCPRQTLPLWSPRPPLTVSPLLPT